MQNGRNTSPKIWEKIHKEKVVAVGEIISRHYSLQIWTIPGPSHIEVMAKAWIEQFDRANIPMSAYHALYDRTVDLRTSRLGRGLECPEFSAELLIACWIGENGLQAEMRRKEIEKKRSLPETATSFCPRCRGTGIEYIFSADGVHLGCRPNCKHLPLEAGEWLWKQIHQLAEEI